MSYDRPDPYYQPEAFDLTPFGSLEREPDYDFHILQVWLHPSGRLYYATDSGCSCPSPFEDFRSLEDLTDVAVNWDEFVECVNDFDGGDAVEKVDLIRRCSALIPEPDFTDLKDGLVKLEQSISRT